MIDMILCGIAYVIMVYFMVILMKKKGKGHTDDDDKDGGIGVSDVPEIDLPPGITLPDGGPGKKINNESLEEILI
jgi:hypothetical protein